MTVGELIKELEKYPEDYDVMFYSGELGGYAFVSKVVCDEDDMEGVVELNDGE